MDLGSEGVGGTGHEDFVTDVPIAFWGDGPVKDGVGFTGVGVNSSVDGPMVGDVEWRNAMYFGVIAFEDSTGEFIGAAIAADFDFVLAKSAEESFFLLLGDG
jgi:hypothetical protein